MLDIIQVKNKSKNEKPRLFWLKNSELIPIIRSEKYTFRTLPRVWGESGAQAFIFPQANRRCRSARYWNRTAEHSGWIPQRMERSAHACAPTLDFRFLVEEG